MAVSVNKNDVHHRATDRDAPESNLLELKSGQVARVLRIQGKAEQVHRLAEFGLRPGVTVRMFRPGSPCIFHFGESKVCFRPDRNLQVYVEPSPTVRAT